jgi:hypothetical protein
MKFRHRVIRGLRVAVVGLAVMAPVAPGAALARPADSSQPAAAFGADHARAVQAKIGDTPADFPGVVPTDPAWVTVGDTPADFPGASRAPEYNGPSTVAIVRPERTTVRDVDQALPIVLAGLALLIAVGGTGYVLVRMRSMARTGLGSSH